MKSKNEQAGKNAIEKTFGRSSDKNSRAPRPTSQFLTKANVYAPGFLMFCAGTGVNPRPGGAFGGAGFFGFFTSRFLESLFPIIPI
jgi:hypothetical protein